MEENIEIEFEEGASEEVTKSFCDSKLPKARKKLKSGSKKKPGRNKNLEKSVTKISHKKRGAPKKKKSDATESNDQNDQMDGIIIKNEFNMNEVKYPVKFDKSKAVVIVDCDNISECENDDNENYYEESNDDLAEMGEPTDNSLVMEVLYDDLVQELDVWENRINPKEEDERKVNDFLSKDCCKRRCVTKFQSDELLLYRLELQSIDYNEHGVNQLDLVLLGLIHSLCRVSDEISHSRIIKKMKRRRIRMMFAFRGVSVCRAMFMFAHCIKVERLKRLLRRYKEEGIAPKPHGNYKRVPSNAITVNQIQEVVAFLRDYAQESAVVVPGRTSYLNQDIKLLPSNETKLNIFNKYKEFCEQKNMSCISVVSFRRLWNKYCPEIVIQRPESFTASNSQKNRSVSKSHEDSDV